MNNNRRDWPRLGEKIVERRLALGMTQQRLAVVAGISQQTLSNLEHGRAGRYFVSTLVKVQTALGWETGSIQDVLAGGQPTEKKIHRTA